MGLIIAFQSTFHYGNLTATIKSFHSVHTSGHTLVKLLKQFLDLEKMHDSSSKVEHLPASFEACTACTARLND